MDGRNGGLRTKRTEKTERRWMTEGTNRTERSERTEITDGRQKTEKIERTEEEEMI